MTIGALIIGDEILRGRRQDKHFPHAIVVLKERGLVLDWCCYLGDERERLTDFFRRSLATEDLVFSFGGIGSTPDDHTRHAVAAAMTVALALHPEAKREIEARFGAQTTPQRLMMGEFPVGARIIPNPYNRVPGFAVGRHHFLPGFPEMAWPMMEWVLDTWCQPLLRGKPTAESAVVVFEAFESALIDLMERVEREFAGVKVFSLPSFGGEGVRRHVELGVRGDPADVDQAIELIRAELRRRGLEWQQG